jgi:hypothetical protein
MFNILSQKITSIKMIPCEGFDNSDNELLADKIFIRCSKTSLVITPLCDTDELKIEEFKEELNVQQFHTEDILSEFVGAKVGYTWEGINSNGYLDVFIIACKNLHPSILILSEGSCLKLFLVKQHRRNL